MNKWLFILFVLCCWNVSAQQVNKAEYFFDTDPGVGNGNAITVSVTDTLRKTFAVSTSGLNKGMHALYIRSGSDSGWSHAEKFPFFISALNEPGLTNGEYFFDADPGVGNGNSIQPAGNPDTSRLLITVPSATLNPGMHSLSVRFKDISGSYSHYEAAAFYITKETASMPDIVAAEYFFQQDPGIGMGMPVNISPANDTVFTSFSLPVDCINTEEWEQLYVRVKDAAGNWSHMESDSFKLHGPGFIVTLHAGLWSDASIWSNGVVPDANTQVILNHPVTVDMNATCKSLFTHCNMVTVLAGKLLQITGSP